MDSLAKTIDQLLPVVIDLDDFSIHYMGLDEQSWECLDKLKEVYPNLKINMFTVPDRSTSEWLHAAKVKYPWLELHYHGSDHKNKKEWFNKTSVDLPYQGENLFVKGFKAPWWKMDQQTADLFNAKGFILSTNQTYPLQGEYTYQYDAGEELIKDTLYKHVDYYSWHGHVQKQNYAGGNGLSQVYDTIAGTFVRDTEFLFITELFKDTNYTAR